MSPLSGSGLGRKNEGPAAQGERGLDQDISRVTRSKDEARRTYDRLSRRYDLLAAAGERRCREAGLRLLAVKEGERVLEIGCGTGQALTALARAVGPGSRGWTSPKECWP